MCSQAHRTEAHGVPKRFMAWKVWQLSLQNLRSFPQEVHLCPHWLGEPTLHPEFERFLQYAFKENTDNQLFRKFKLHTNGVLFDSKRASALLDLAQSTNQAPDTFNFVHFSIDAFSPEVYKKVKGADHQERVFRNIQFFLKERELRSLSYPKITIAFVVQDDNYQEAIPFRDFWQEEWDNANIPLEVFGDWPSFESDNLYFRRLNCGEQKQADILFSKTIKVLEIENSAGDIRNIESF
jgi:sulfatase maturation enzyme AslB (radical SAM superfamily)